ncbi:unnamed protein product, partial [Medioppia subpectinata]
MCPMPFKHYNEIIVDAELKAGAMIEISRKDHKHWVMCESVSRGTGIVRCYHVEPNQDQSLAWIKHETLRHILRKGRAREGSDSKPVYDLCRVNNQKIEAQRRQLTEVDLKLIFDTLWALRDKMVNYSPGEYNCEWYCTQWKYGTGWSTNTMVETDNIHVNIIRVAI